MGTPDHQDGPGAGLLRAGRRRRGDPRRVALRLPAVDHARDLRRRSWAPGAAKRLSAVRWGVAGNIVGAWVLDAPGGGRRGALVYGVVSHLRHGAIGPLVVCIAIGVGVALLRPPRRRRPHAPARLIAGRRHGGAVRRRVGPLSPASSSCVIFASPSSGRRALGHAHRGTAARRRRSRRAARPCRLSRCTASCSRRRGASLRPGSPGCPGTRSRAARGRAPGGDREGRQVVGDDAVGADDAALADRHAAGDDDVGAAPDVVADPGRALGGEALPGDRLVGVVEAVVAVGDEAAVGEHAVAADLDELDRGDHHVDVQERALADAHAAIAGAVIHTPGSSSVPAPTSRRPSRRASSTLPWIGQRANASPRANSSGSGHDSRAASCARTSATSAARAWPARRSSAGE